MHVHHLRDRVLKRQWGSLCTAPVPFREEEDRDFGVEVGTMGGSEVQTKSEFYPQSHTAFEERDARGGWSHFGATSW